MIDLHLHTTNSDGTDPPEELIRKLKELGITRFAITDHNNIDSFGDVQRICSTSNGNNPGNNVFGLDYCPGVEISSILNDREYHILGYGRNVDNPEIRSMVKAIKDEMEEHAVELIFKITKEDHAEKYHTYDYDRTRGGWKSLNYLIDLGVIGDKSGFWEYNAVYRKTPRYFSPDETINILKSNGLYAVLAHPPIYQDDDCMPEENLLYWRDIGIMGFECRNIYYQKEESIGHYIEFCRKYDLLITGGSDYHGSFVPRKLGSLMITEDDLSLGQLANEFITI